jgi:FkbM family methyltransferase
MPPPGITRLALVSGKVSETFRLIRRFHRHIPSLGFSAAAVVFFCEASTRRPIAPLLAHFAAERVKVKPSHYQYPIRFRRVGSDLAVFSQMLVRREYAPVAKLRDVRLIVDCGANIGLSAYYLLHCYPQARLIAIEPDAENYALCRQNLAPFADRSMVMQAAVWRENGWLRIVPASRHGGAWALKVEPWHGGDVEGVTIPEILRRADEHGPIDLLKVDIEGAEVALFEARPEWLAMTRNIAIELHGPEADATFTRALDGYGYERRQADELTIAYDLKPRTL